VPEQEKIMNGRDDDREERRGRFRERDERHRCRPHYGDIVERVEILKRVPPDDAIEVLRTIIDSAFFEGVACGCMACECEEREERRERFDDRDRRRWD
jgi:hypothetical protein